MFRFTSVILHMCTCNDYPSEILFNIFNISIWKFSNGNINNYVSQGWELPVLNLVCIGHIDIPFSCLFQCFMSNVKY